MPRSKRRHRTRSHSRARSHSAGSLQYEHKRRHIDYDSPQNKGAYSFSGERALRARQHDRGTSQERRYKRSHRRSPSCGRQHEHRERDRDLPTSSRRARIYRHASSSTSQDRHRHCSPSSRSQVSLEVSTIDI